MNIAEAGSWQVPEADGWPERATMQGRLAGLRSYLASMLRTSVRLMLLVILVAITAVMLVLSALFAAITSRCVARRVTVHASRAVLRVLNVRVQVAGRTCDTPALLACNHLSWIDILVMHSVFPEATFVAKDDVARWPVIARAARALETVFVARLRKRDLLRTIPAVATALQRRAVVLFAEGTTSDGSRTLPFRTSLFEAATRGRVPVVPVSLRAIVPSGRASARTHVAWCGDTTLLAHIPLVASLPRVVYVVRIGDPLRALSAPRKRLGRAAQQSVARQAGHVHVASRGF